jgi:hypothetical protein
MMFIVRQSLRTWDTLVALVPLTHVYLITVTFLISETSNSLEILHQRVAKLQESNARSMLFDYFVQINSRLQ